MSSPILPAQIELRVTIPTVEGNVDYQQWRQQLERIDQLLLQSGLEDQFVALSLEHWKAQATDPLESISVQQQQKFQEHSRRALRCNIARTLRGEAYRPFSARLADSPLLQWFCLLDRIDVVRVPGKSTLQRYGDWLPSPTLRPFIEQLLRRAGTAPATLQLAQPIDLDRYFIDTSCVEAHIHFPVDWVLLRDGTRTLMKAITLIRQQGLRSRMAEPSQFLKEMNQLSIQMTHTRRKSDSKKARKRVLRLMKKQIKLVRGHGQTYRQLLAEQWEETDWTGAQADQVLKRIDRVLEQLPAAQRQAHERIIGERVVKNEEKILSLYEPDVHVIVRGKAGAEVEFGNTLLLGENPQGLILDWELFRDTAPADVKLVQPSVERVRQAFGSLQEVGTDRGFDSQANQNWLTAQKIYSGICPKNPRQLQERMKEERFRRLHQRRSQTEGRIGIFKNEFLGRPLRAKGFAHREQAVVWGVLTHNLWVLARLPQTAKEEELTQAA